MLVALHQYIIIMVYRQLTILWHIKCCGYNISGKCRSLCNSTSAKYIFNNSFLKSDQYTILGNYRYTVQLYRSME